MAAMAIAMPIVHCQKGFFIQLVLCLGFLDMLKRFVGFTVRCDVQIACSIFVSKRNCTVVLFVVRCRCAAWRGHRWSTRGVELVESGEPSRRLHIRRRSSTRIPILVVQFWHKLVGWVVAVVWSGDFRKKEPRNFLVGSTYLLPYVVRTRRMAKLR